MCNILLVEDHKVMAETLARILRTKGNFKVADAAESAEDANGGTYLSKQLAQNE